MLGYEKAKEDTLNTIHGVVRIASAPVRGGRNDIVRCTVEFSDRDNQAEAEMIARWGQTRDELEKLAIGQELDIGGDSEIRSYKKEDGTTGLRIFVDSFSLIEVQGLGRNPVSVIIYGNMGRDPEIKYFESTKHVTKGTVAARQASRDADSNWFNYEAWGMVGVQIADNMKKGDPCILLGGLGVDCWEKNGQRFSRPVLRVSKVTFVPRAEKKQAIATAEDNF